MPYEDIITDIIYDTYGVLDENAPEPEVPITPTSETFTHLVLDSLEQQGIFSGERDRHESVMTGYLLSIGTQMQALYDLVTERNGRPGWADPLDPDTANFMTLPWLAQFVGVRLATNKPIEPQRSQVQQVAGWGRGRVMAIVAAAQQYLTGRKTVHLTERYEDDPYTFHVQTYDDETPNPTRVEEALKLAKPAGLILVYDVVIGTDYATFASEYATYTIADAAFGTYKDAQFWRPEP